MTLTEFSNEFDVLYDNASNSAPGLDAYEKSVFLTTAQEEIVLSYFSPKQNKPREGFDDSEKRQMDFSSIIKTYTFDSTGEKNKDGGITHLLEAVDKSIYTGATSKANIGEIPDLLIIVNEFINVDRPEDSISTTEYERTPNIIPLTVVPIMYKEYARLMSKPFKRPKFYQAWRILDNEKDKLTSYLIAGPKDTITSYSVRYVKKPRPIIIGDTDELKIDGQLYNENKGCELDSILHREIIKRAVELAMAAYSNNVTDKIQLGNLSQTDIGVQ